MGMLPQPSFVAAIWLVGIGFFLGFGGTLGCWLAGRLTGPHTPR